MERSRRGRARIHPMSSRAQMLRSALFLFALALPFIVVGVFSTSEIGTWLSTGMCPGGPMDQVAGPCGPLHFFMRVFLGGWVAFIFIPLVLLWWAILTLVYGYCLRRS